MKNGITRLLYTSLILLLVFLFAAGYWLNLKQYRSSISNAEMKPEKTLDRQKQQILQHLDRTELQAYDLYGTDRLLEADLFAALDGTLLPACIADLTREKITRKDADDAFAKGIERLPSEEALPFFETAAKGPAETEPELYQKISALFNLLDFRTSPQTACLILTNLRQDRHPLSESRKEFFYSMLNDRFPDLNDIESRLDALLKTAQILNRNNELKKGSNRTKVDSGIFAVRHDGLAVLYDPGFDSFSSAEIAESPAGIHREIIPGYYITASAADLQKEKQKIKDQYLGGNLILSVLALPAAILAAALIGTNRRQQKLNAMRTQFIATVSHELRTPLSLIRLHAETLRHGRIPEDKIADYHQTILTESERLSGIVSNVLDFSRMERGEMRLNPEPTNLSELTGRIIESFYYRFEEEGFHVKQTVEPGINGIVDGLAYSQILFNLLDNAVKYSDDIKEIQITLKMTDQQVVLQIADRGIGVPDKLKKTIFNDFVRSDEASVTARRGSGIGLSVVRKLINMMNGTIEITDNQPSGSVFTVKQETGHETAGC